jgi:hypothetical protein
MDLHNKWLEGNFTAAKDAVAQEMRTNMTTALANVKAIIDDLNKLATIGMPAKSLNAFFTSYPLQKCDGAPPTTPGSTPFDITRFLPGAQKLLIGDGLLPLPMGATPVPPSSRGSANTTAAPTTGGAESNSTTGDATMGASGQSAGGVMTGTSSNATMGTGGMGSGTGTSGSGTMGSGTSGSGTSGSGTSGSGTMGSGTTTAPAGTMGSGTSGSGTSGSGGTTAPAGTMGTGGMGSGTSASGGTTPAPAGCTTKRGRKGKKRGQQPCSTAAQGGAGKHRKLML